MFFGQSIALCRHDWASFGLWGFRKNETSSFCSWIWWFSPTFSVSADIDVRPCYVPGEKTQRTFPPEASPTSPYRLWVQSVAWLSKLWMFWQMPFETAKDAAMSLNQGAHTHESGRWARWGAFTGELSAGRAPTRHFYCGSYTGNLLKLFCQFTLFSIHAIGIAWNDILLKISNLSLSLRLLKTVLVHANLSRGTHFLWNFFVFFFSQEAEINACAGRETQI